MDNQLLDDNLLRDSGDVAEFEMASLGKRFGTFVIDYLMTQVVVGILAVIYVAMNPDNLSVLVDETRNKGMDYLLGVLGFFSYYWFFESVCKGRTIGKMVCGTRALTTDGELMSSGTVLKRTLSRLVPFDPLSFFGGYASGWHDRWTDTMVITEDSYKASFR